MGPQRFSCLPCLWRPTRDVSKVSRLQLKVSSAFQKALRLCYADPPGGRGCVLPSPAWALHGSQTSTGPFSWPSTLEWAFGPKQAAQESRGWSQSHTAVPGPGWVFFTPRAQSGPRPLVDIDRDRAEITRGSWCPSGPFAFRGPAKTCRSEHEPPGQHWNLNTRELPGYSQRPHSTGQMDTWEGRREWEGLTLPVRGAPDRRESWREPHRAASSSHVAQRGTPVSKVGTKS